MLRHISLSLALLGCTLSALAGPPRGDRYGDPLPEGAVARLGSIRLAHDEEINSLAFTPDDKMLLAGSAYSIRLWQAGSGREVRRFTIPDSTLVSAAFSPDGKMVAGGEYGRRVILWDAATGKELRTLKVDSPTVGAVAWSPDGRWLAAGGGRVLYIWEAVSGKQFWRLEGHTGNIRALVFAPGGQLLVTGDEHGVRLWDLAREKFGQVLEGIVEHVQRALAFSPDGKLLVTAYRLSGQQSSGLRVWEVATGKKVREIPCWAGCAAFSPDGTLLAVGGGAQIQLWDAQGWQEVRKWQGHTDRVGALAFSRDGKTLAAGGDDRRVRLWDPATGKMVAPAGGHWGAVKAVVFAPDGKTLASGSMDRTLRFWDWRTGRELHRCEDLGMPSQGINFGVSALAYAPDGKRLVSAEVQNEEPILRLWDDQGKLLKRFGERSGAAQTLVFAPDNERVIVTNHPASVSVYEPTRGKLLHRLGRNDNPRAFTVSPDGRVAAWSGGTHTLKVWEVATGQERFATSTPARYVIRIAFSPDGKQIVTVDGNGPINLWDAVTGEMLGEWGETKSGRPGALVFSPDGRLLALGNDRGVALWEMATRQEVCRFTGHQNAVRDLAFASDGRVVASASLDSTLLVWDVTGLLKAGQLPALKLDAKDLERRWQALTGTDAARAHRAIWALSASPDALPVLEHHLTPVVGVAAEKIQSLIADLTDDSFPRREKAERALGELGAAARPALERARASAGSTEAAVRMGRLLKSITDQASGRNLWQRRAIAVLEHAGTTEARRLLQRLASGAAEAQLTQDARAALQRLGPTR